MTCTACTDTAPDAFLNTLAQKHFYLETLELQNSDRLDFCEVSVSAIRAALLEAYEAGLRTGSGPDHGSAPFQLD